MALSEEEWELLRSASDSFLTDPNFNTIEISEVLEEVFGPYSERSTGPLAPAAKIWTTYFSALEGYEHERRDDPSLVAPVARPFMPDAPTDAVMSESLADNAMDIDASEPQAQVPAPAAQTEKRPKVCKSDKKVREAEREKRRKNGNQLERQAYSTGAQFDELAARLVIESWENGKWVYYCICCDKSRTNNAAQSRAYPHAVRDCPKLPNRFPEEFKAAKEGLLKKGTLSSVLEGTAEPAPVRTRTRKVDDPNEGRIAQTSIHDHLRPVKLTPPQQARIDYCLLRMFICCALAWTLVDNGFFVDFCKALCPSYPVPSRSDFFSPKIAGEVTKVMEALYVHLTTLWHLTLSFDGWSSRLHDEIYTVHITTALRSSFLVDGLVLTGQSVTAELLCSKLGEVILRYSAQRFSLIVSDTTGNVKKTRVLVCKEYPWIFNCGDPCHQLNLLAKDLIQGSKRRAKISPLAGVISIVSGLTSYFSHSNYGQFWLREELKSEEDKRGIETAGATRFSSFSTNAKSVARCLPAMMRAYQKGKLKFETAAAKKNVEKYLKVDMANLTLQQNLKVVNALLTPIDRGLKTLEGQKTTLSDVFMVYIGIGMGFAHVFSSGDELIAEYQQATYNIFDYRFNILMTESTPDIFLFAYFLDPVYSRDNALRLNLPERRSFSKATAPPLYLRILKTAISVLQGEQARLKEGTKEEQLQQLKDLSYQMAAFAYKEPPFDRECTDMALRLPYFESLEGDPRATVIAPLGIKVNSVSPSEMCDERTASRMTAMNTAKRNKLTGQHIIQMAQLQQHWTYGLEAPKTTHTARLALPDALPTTGKPTYLPTPRLDDLLNPATDADMATDAARFEESLFNAPDPYHLESLSDDDEDDDAPAVKPMEPEIMRGAPRLGIENLVNSRRLLW
ncbi:hypothetical protein MKEN_00281800 [Mycena kentingensis (nom. inval.)]|nr:hypothetical protein MKEN_00281800 [Mycena kentingensis (nom. inval.)]